MMPEDFPPPEEVEEKVAALIATLHETERRLEELTGGEIDTVSTGSGRPFLLRRAQEERRNAEVTRQAAILDALPAHIALLDAKGTILSVNETWRKFASANFLQGPAFGVGVNYLEICDRATEADSSEARNAAAGVRSVLASAGSFSLEYACHAPHQQRWFSMTVTPLPGVQMHGAVVMHVDITQRMQAAIAFKDLSQHTARRERMLTTTLSNLNDFAYIFDRAGRFLFANQPLLTLLGRTLEEVVGQDFVDLGYPPDLARRLQRQIQEVFTTQQSLTDETPYTTPSGVEGFYEYIFSPALGADGTVEFVVGATRDVSERKRAEMALRASNQKFQQLTDNITDVFWIRSPDFKKLHYISPAFERIWGRSVASLEANPQEWVDFVLPEDRERVVAAFATITDRNPGLEIEYRIVRPNGELRWIRVRAFQVRNADDQLIRHIGIVTDITARMRVATELRTSLAELRTLAESMPQIVWVARANGDCIYINQQWVDYTGRILEESLGNEWIKSLHPADQKPVSEAWQHATATGGVYSIEGRLRRTDGVYRWWLMRGVPQQEAGDILKWFGTCTDIHDLKQAALEISRANRTLELQQSELRVLIDLMPAEIAFKGTDNIFRRVNQRFAHSMGRSVAELEGKSSTEIFPQAAARYDAEDAKVTTSGVPEVGVVKSSRDREGNEVWHQIDKVPVCESGGKVIGLVIMAQDITDRKRVADELRVSEKRFKALFEQAAVGVAQADVTTGQFVQINQRFGEILGRSPEELLLLTFAAVTHPEDIALSLDIARQLKAGPLREFTMEKRYLRKDDSEVWVNMTVSAMWAPGDEPDYFIAVAQDVTGRKKLEDQFRQAQKMEAIGTLAGGIAHDFNNILAAINGYTELSKMQLTGNPEVRGYLGSVLQASGRATELVRQILTFSRQQKVERRPIQLQPIVTEAFKLLRASIPATIEFEISLKDAPVVLADATQIHQVLMNLGTNAWHAMKDRPGRLQVKLERSVVDASHASIHGRLHPGDYARLSVSDSGSGMDQETLKRIFEPFFTTKPVGEGTGLGLAVVHGIMAAHDGAVTVYSEPGEGTVFHLYFPAFAGAMAAAIDLGEVARGHGERILFVDDEELLVKLGKQTLTALGYEVEVTTQPAAALAMVRADPQRFALVLTDQTMPGMTGVDLARQLLQLRPGLPIILLTGYGLSLTSERIKAAGIRHLLLKPTTVHTLGSAVHAAISAPALL